jgi:phosphonate transport system substrate-binding protein
MKFTYLSFSHSRHYLQVVFLIAGFLASCAPTPSTPIPTATPTLNPITQTAAPPTQTPRPTSTPTLPPLGSEGNPIKIGFVLKPEDSAAIEASEDVAFLLAQETGYAVEHAIFPDFISLATAATHGDVDLFWLSPFEYLYLNSFGAADVFLMTNHLGVYAYGVQFLANVNRGFMAYFDPQTQQPLGEFLPALQQFSGTRPCFISPNSLPGYYVPMGLLANTSTPTLDPVFTYSYNATIRALFIQGICDFGVSYALIGDPLNASDIAQNLPDAQSQIITIWQTDGIIPNTNLSSSPSIPLPMRYRIEEAVLKLSAEPETLSLISTALAYEVSAIKAVDDSFYESLRSAIAPLELDLESITHQ